MVRGNEKLFIQRSLPPPLLINTPVVTFKKTKQKQQNTPISSRLVQDDSFFDDITNSKNFLTEVRTYSRSFGQQR